MCDTLDGFPESIRAQVLELHALKSQEDVAPEKQDDDWTPSGFMADVKTIAEKEGDEIGTATYKQLEQLLEVNDSVPKVSTGNVKDFLTVTKDCVDLGKIVFDRFSKQLGPVGATAGLIKDLVGIAEPKKDDPVLKELGELASQLTALSHKMTAQFDDLKSFIVEQEFLNKFTISLTTMFMYMTDTIASRSKASVELFREVYLAKRPQLLVYEMLAKLELDASNPLKWAMRAEMQRRSTFNKWRGILESVLTEALLLEVYAGGLLGDVDDWGTKMIVEKMGRYFELVKQWDRYYLNNADYWPKSVEKLIDDAHDNRSLERDTDKLDAVWKELDSIHTNDKFYAIAFGDHIWRSHLERKSNVIESFRRGINIIVWRSPNPSLDYLRKLKPLVELNVREPDRHKVSWQFDHWKIAKSWIKSVELELWIERVFHGVGMILVVVQSESHVHVKCSKWDGWNYGPGYYTFDGRLQCDDSFTKKNKPLTYLYAI